MKDPSIFEKELIPFLCKPINTAGALTVNGIQWSSKINTVNADQNYTLDLGTFEPPWKGKIDGVTSNGIIEASLTFGLVSNAATPTCNYSLQVRNKGGVFVNLKSPSNEAISATEEEHTWSGIFPTVTNFNSVPFDIQLTIRCADAVNIASARLKSSSYIAGNYVPGT